MTTLYESASPTTSTDLARALRAPDRDPPHSRQPAATTKSRALQHALRTLKDTKGSIMKNTDDLKHKENDLTSILGALNLDPRGPLNLQNADSSPNIDSIIDEISEALLSNSELFESTPETLIQQLSALEIDESALKLQIEQGHRELEALANKKRQLLSQIKRSDDSNQLPLPEVSYEEDLPGAHLPPATK